MNNTCYIASAGAGKTTLLISIMKDRLSQISKPYKKIIFITFTENNQENIKKRIRREFGIIPSNVIVIGWFTFLMRYWINPYKGDIIDELCGKSIGVCFYSGKSGVQKQNNGSFISTYKKGDNKAKYLTLSGCNIPSDMLSDFAYQCYRKNHNALIERLYNICDSILIDESQDFAGYDFEIIKAIIKTQSIPTIIVGDPRQHTYNTHYSKKHKEYCGDMSLFIKEQINTTKKTYIQIDSNTLSKSHRCVTEICELASILTKKYPTTAMCDCEICNQKRSQIEHKGCFLIKDGKVDDFINRFEPVALRWNKTINIHNNIKYVYNFGDSKGDEYDITLIYPTKPILQWIKNSSSKLADKTISNFYVAITRARFLAVIIVPDDFQYNGGNLRFWEAGYK